MTNSELKLSVHPYRTNLKKISSIEIIDKKNHKHGSIKQTHEFERFSIWNVANFQERVSNFF